MIKPIGQDFSYVRQRNLVLLTVLVTVTLGLWWIYLGYQWSKEINGLEGRVKYPPLVLLVVNLVTCGLAGLVFECIFAYDIERSLAERRIGGRLENLGLWILVLNVVGVVFSATVVGVVIGFPLGVVATVLLQAEINKIAASEMPLLKEAAA